MHIVYFSLTPQGDALAQTLAKACPGTIITKAALNGAHETFAQATARCWKTAGALVFIMAAGIVVRTVAPLLKSKTSDPAVVVMDSAGHFAVSLLSGHLGGANEMAVRLAAVTGGQPVITTGTDVAGTLAFDVFAKAYGMRIENIRELKWISAAMIAGRPVTVYTSWPLSFDFPDNVTVVKAQGIPAAQNVPENDTEAVFIGHRYDEPAAPDCLHLLRLRPKNLYVGIGCKRDADSGAMAAAFEDFLDKSQICREEVAGLATIALKKDEPAICSLARQYGYPLIVIDTKVIAALEAEGAVSSSAFVRSVTGVGSVCEGAALAAACRAAAPDVPASELYQEAPDVSALERLPGRKQVRLIRPKTKYAGMTFALAEHCIMDRKGRD